MSAPRLLVTGFLPFGEHGVNPAASIAEAAHGQVFHGLEIVGVTVPVRWDEAFPAIEEAVRDVAPQALLMFGVANRPTFCFEVVARNTNGPKADASGRLPPAPEVVPGAPRQLTARLPFSRLSAGDAPVTYSDDAGDYLCNHVLFRALWSLPRLGVRGFVHVPPLPGSGLSCAMAWERLRAGGLALVTSLASTLRRG